MTTMPENVIELKRKEGKAPYPWYERGKLEPGDMWMVYQLLQEDLPVEGIQHVPANVSRKGYDATGYGYQFIVNRLNEVLFGHWRAIHRIVSEEEGTTNSGKARYSVMMHMTIQIGNWHVKPETGERYFEVLMEGDEYGGHESLEKFSAYKGAYTNAFKKAAGMLGIGKKAFEGTLDEDYFSAEAQEAQEAKSGKKQQGKKQEQAQTPPAVKYQTKGQKDQIQELVLQITDGDAEKRNQLQAWVAKKVDGFQSFEGKLTYLQADHVIKLLKAYQAKQGKK